MNWETENSGLLNTIRRLEDDLQDHRLDLVSRAASPERGSPPRDRGTDLASMTQGDVLDMINSAITTRERGRSPARFDLAAGDGAEGPPGGTGGDIGGEGNPEGGNYDDYDANLDQFLGQEEGGEDWWNIPGAPRNTDPDPYGRWILGPGGGTAGILRYKEAETIPTPSFPSGPQVPQWRMNLAKTLAASTGRYDQAEINWFVSEGFGPGVTFESLADSGAPRFRSLDMKLSAALSKMVRTANNQLSIDLATIEEKMIDEGTMLMGRQIAWKLYMYYQCNPIMDFTYGVRDLTHLPWQGDSQIANFLGCWRLIIRKMRTQLSDDELGEILYDKIRSSKEMANDLAHYERQELNHPDRSYKYLLKCMDRRLHDAQLKRNRANDEAAIRSGNVSGFGKMAVPATGGGNPPGKKAQAKAAAKAAKALATSSADIDARIAAGIAAAVKGKGKGKGDGPPGGK
eukprot:13195147-Heterocapsa_arctica.AAC.1